LTLCLALVLTLNAINGLAQAVSAPSLDGLIDSVYFSHGRSLRYLDVYGVTGADLYVLDNAAVDPNYVWATWEIDRTYVDASYGANKHSSWGGQGHSFNDLKESDKQRILFINTCGELVLDVSMDILDCSFGSAPSGCDVGKTVGESSMNYINGNDWTKFEFDTSMAANLNFSTGHFLNSPVASEMESGIGQKTAYPI
jgi:hypothetical protein